jgi:hypothetical protein
MRNKMMFVRRALYALKREYGMPMDIYRLSNGVFDPTTGKQSQSKVKYHVQNALLLPTTMLRKFLHNVSYEKATSREFSYGGSFEQDQKFVAVDLRDFPKSILPIDETTDRAVVNHQLFVIKKGEEFEHQQAMLLTLSASEGTLPTEEFDLTANNGLVIAQNSVNG